MNQLSLLGNMQFFVVAVVVVVIFVLSVHSRNENEDKKYCGDDQSNMFYFNGWCYIFVQDSLEWTGQGEEIHWDFEYAYSKCNRALRGSLLTIRSAEEHAFIEEILAEKKTWCVNKPCWLGLRFQIPSMELDDIDGWRWSDGTSVGFIPKKKYYLPNPKNGTEEQFISFILNASVYSPLTRFNNREASSSLQFICERNVSNNDDSCIHIYRASCYVYVNQTLNYSKAVEKCLNLSASLVSIETDEEEAFLSHNVTSEYNMEIWTSLKFNSTLELWFWNTTGKELSITFETYQLTKTYDKKNQSRCASLVWNNEGNYSFVTNVYSEKCYSKLRYWCKVKADTFDQCGSNLCLNGGTCIDGWRTYKCRCPEEWAGRLCQYRSTCKAGYLNTDFAPEICLKVYKDAMEYMNASSLCKQTKTGQILGAEYFNYRYQQYTITAEPIWFGLTWDGNATDPRDGYHWKWSNNNGGPYFYPPEKRPIVTGNLTEESCFYLHVPETNDTVHFKQAQSCNESRPYVCESSKRNRFFRHTIHTDKKTKYNAEKACEQDNDFLADFDSDLEIDFVQRYLSFNHSVLDFQGPWIGLTVIDSTFVWSKHSDYMPNGKLGITKCEHQMTVTQGQNKSCVIEHGSTLRNDGCRDLENVNCDEEHAFICVYEQDENDCNQYLCNEGICIDDFHGFRCYCSESDFTGEYCDTWIDDCKEHKCEHWSTCVDGTRHYTCTCLGEQAFTGDRCEIGPCDRTHDLCRNNGVCKNAANDPFYVCHCLDKFTGKHCTEPKDDEEEDIFEILIPILVVVVSFLVSGGLIHFIIQYQKRQQLKHKTQGSQELESEYVKETVGLWERVRVVKKDSSKVGRESVVKVDKIKVGEIESVVKVDIEQIHKSLELGKQPRVGSSFFKTDVNDDNKNSIKALRGHEDSRDAAKDKDKEKHKHQELCVKNTDLQPCDDGNDSIKGESGVGRNMDSVKLQ